MRIAIIDTWHSNSGLTRIAIAAAVASLILVLGSAIYISVISEVAGPTSLVSDQVYGPSSNRPVPGRAHTNIEAPRSAPQSLPPSPPSQCPNGKGNC